MIIVLAVLQIVAPVFLLAAIGFGWVKLGFEFRVQFVTRLTMSLAVPSLIFTALVKTEIDPAPMASFVLASVMAYALLSGGMYLFVRGGRLNVRTYWAPLVFGNTGNLGLPLAFFAFGAEGLGYAVVIFAIMGVISFTFGLWMVAGSGSLARVLREPLIWASVLGAVFLYSHWHLPAWAMNTLELIGQMAIPLMLLTLGVAVARLHPVGLGRAAGFALAKLLAAILIGHGVGVWFDLPPVAFGILILQLSTPVAVTSYLLAEKYEAGSEQVAALVVMSTALSVVSLPVLLGFLL